MKKRGEKPFTGSKSKNRKTHNAVCTDEIKLMEEKPELVRKCHDVNVKTKSNEDLTHPIRLVWVDNVWSNFYTVDSRTP